MKAAAFRGRIARATRRERRLGRLGAALWVAAWAVGCADENDPKTWVKRLDDPTQRVAAMKRLEQFFNDTMTQAGNRRDDEKVRKMLDEAVAPLSKVYTTGGLDARTRKDLIKLLADMGDKRAAPAFAKAFKDFEPGHNDEDVRFAAQGTTRLAQGAAGQGPSSQGPSSQGVGSKPISLGDPPLVDALWECFAKFRPSANTKSLGLVKDLQGAVMAVKDPSYGPKAMALLGAPVTDPKDPTQGMDQIQFWQATSARLIGEIRFTPAVRSLVTVLMTPTKSDLVFPVRLALTRMPNESEPVLIAALKGTDPEFATLAKLFPSGEYVARLAEPLAYISRPGGRDATLDVLSTAKTDETRTVLATELTHYPGTPTTIRAFREAYAKVAPDAAVASLGGGNARAAFMQVASMFFDPSLTEWLLKETAAAKGEAADAMPPSAYPSAIKLMTPAQSKAVGDAVQKIPGQAVEKDMYEAARKPLEKCNDDAACYVAVLDTPVPSSPPPAKMGHVKAAWMSGIYGSAQTRGELVGRLEKIKDGSVRLAMAEAIDHLSPVGDVAAAERLEKVVDGDNASGVKAATDEIYRIALKLRSRAASGGSR